MNDVPNDGSKSLDIFGIKPISDSVNTVVDTTTKNASEFLKLICFPAAQEFGLLLQDKVRYWWIKTFLK